MFRRKFGRCGNSRGQGLPGQRSLPKRSFAESAVGRVGTVFVHFSRRSTLHGLNHMAQARTNRRRLYWVMISLCASTGFFINLYHLFEKYFQVPVLTNVLHDDAMFEFPDITFCLLNPIYFPPKNTTAYVKLMQHIDAYHQKYVKNRRHWHLQLSDYLFIHAADSYSHPPWSAIVECRYDDGGAGTGPKCSYRAFTVRRLWPYGNCYTFNATAMSRQRRISFKMKMNSFRPDFRLIVHKSLSYPANYSLDPHGSAWISSGILVMIHEAQTYPHIGESFLVDGVTQIDIRITRLQHLPKKSKCQPNRRNFTYVDRTSGAVDTFLGTATDCVVELKQELMARHCGCVYIDRQPLYKFRHMPICNEEKHSIEYMQRCINYLQNEKSEIEKLGSYCLTDLCEHTSFSTVISQAKYPAIRERNTHKLWLKHLRNLEAQEVRRFDRSDFAERGLLDYGRTHRMNLSTAFELNRTDLLNVDYVEQNFMMLRVVPASFFMDRVEEVEEYPLSRLLSDIGGCVGLWIGASLITLFELIDLMFDFGDQSIAYQRRKVLRKKAAMNGKYSSVPTSLYNGKTTSNLYSIPGRLETDNVGEAVGADDDAFKAEIVRGFQSMMSPPSVPTSDSELSTPLKTISTDLVTTV